jgi:transcription elongation factor Elf1
MDQQVPDFDLVTHDGPMVCDFCHEEVTFLVGITQTETALDGNHCKKCFRKHSPEFTDSITDFAELLDMFLEMKAQKMTVEDMYELYGEGEEPPEEEDEEELEEDDVQS